jgi:hypothetical protein
MWIPGHHCAKHFNVRADGSERPIADGRSHASFAERGIANGWMLRSPTGWEPHSRAIQTVPSYTATSVVQASNLPPSFSGNTPVQQPSYSVFPAA